MAGEGRDPDHRFSLANERTYLAWVRTALATMAAAVGVLKLGPGGDVAWLRRALAVALGVLGLALAGAIYHQWRRTERAMRTGESLPRSPLVPLLGAGLTIVGVGVLVLVVAA